MADQLTCSVIGKKAAAFSEGIQNLERVQQELNSNVSSATAWGLTAVMANLTLVPLNAVVNSLPAPKSKTLVQSLATWLYGQYGKSGTRIDDAAAKKTSDAVGKVRDIITMELKSAKLVEYIPGVNIIAGAIQDSLAAWKTTEMFDAGQKEMKRLQQNMQGSIAKMKQTLKDLQDIYDRDCNTVPQSQPVRHLT